MMRSPGGQEPDSLAPLYSSVLNRFQDDLAEQIDFQQMFILIEGVLPFEVCLYYQVLPLFLEGSRMVLGMVSPYDRAASDYVRRLISYHHYTVTVRQITSEALQAALSAYLNYAGQHHTLERVPEPMAPHVMRRSQTPFPLDNSLPPTLVVDSPDALEDARQSPTAASAAASSPASPTSPHPPAATWASPPLAQPDAALPNGIHQPTDAAPLGPSPMEPVLAPQPSSSAPANGSGLPLTAPATSPSSTPDAVAEGTVPAAGPPSSAADPSDSEGAASVTDAASAPRVPPAAARETTAAAPVEAAPGDRTRPQQPAPTMALPTLIQPIPTLELQLNYLTSPIEVLDSLPPEELVQELLGRVLMKGIGRLYLEQQATHGRVLWSQEGIVQSVLEHLPTDRLQGVINGLKRVAGLSLAPLKQPKKLDIERIFDHERVLLRFRFMPVEHGEEATLQVLRGAALRFYQQQQLTVLERDALGIAKQLQHKLSELRDRAYAESTLSGARLEILPALSHLLQEMEAEIKTMQAAIAMPEGASRRKPDA